MIEGMSLWVAQTNCWLVAPDGPGGECVLIDAPPDPRTIINRLHHHGLKLVALLNTHGHLDHIGGVGTIVHELDEGPDVEVRIHELDRHLLTHAAENGGMLAQYLEGLDMRPPEVIYDIDDGEVIRGAGMTFTAIHTPGHTMGSVCFTMETDDAKVLFSGDHLFRGSIGRTDLPGGSYEVLMQSMADKILPLPDEMHVLPGHGDTSTIGLERRYNPFILELRDR